MQLNCRIRFGDKIKEKENMSVIFLALLCVKSEPIPDRNRLSHRSNDRSTSLLKQHLLNDLSLTNRVTD